MNENNKKESKFSTDEILNTVYDAIKEKGYDPARQIAGYILSEDPTYVPDHMGARGMIRHLNRDELLKLFIEFYFEHTEGK